MAIELTEINTGVPQSKCGHLIYKGASYEPAASAPMPVIYKENTNHNPDLSIYEVAFSAIARLFLAPHLTARTHLVKNREQGVVGIASEHIRSVIQHREPGDEPTVFYELSRSSKKTGPLVESVDASDKIPYYFLDECDPLFFHHLQAQEKQGALSLDYTSLAEIFTASYMLEEDDLHKGNLGFWARKQGETPHVSFFKIDHDYMLTDELMSHFKTRFLNGFYGDDAYAITARDLVDFPVLKDSHNYYWPTLNHVLNVGTKAYSAYKERAAFASLAHSDEFKRAKWHAFYRHVLIPPAFVQQALEKDLDPANPAERAKIALIMQALVARQAKLRAVLFSIKEFREVVLHLDSASEEQLIKAMGFSEGSEFIQSTKDSIRNHQKLCGASGVFVDNDTPLHTAIKLQDYRYDDTWKDFRQYARQQNAAGQTPWDLAAQGLDQEVTSNNARSILSHLKRVGVQDTVASETTSSIQSKDYLNQSEYLTCAPQKKTAIDLIALLRDLGEDHRYSLKMQKEIALLCVHRFVNEHRTHPQLPQMLLSLKHALNGHLGKPPAPELQFIRQLRSQLWIIRYIRGLFGGTTTQYQINRLIDQTMRRTIPSVGVNPGLFERRPSGASEIGEPSSAELDAPRTPSPHTQDPEPHVAQTTP